MSCVALRCGSAADVAAADDGNFIGYSFVFSGTGDVISELAMSFQIW
jgi:hypothetical protein